MLVYPANILHYTNLTLLVGLRILSSNAKSFGHKGMKSHISSVPCFYIRQASKNGLCDWCSKTQEHLPTARNPWESRTCHPASSHRKVQVSAMYCAFNLNASLSAQNHACKIF